MEKYLTHQLIKHAFEGYDSYQDFTCEICGVYLCKMDSIYFLLKDDGSDTLDEDEFLLTCNQFIIKKIIE